MKGLARFGIATMGVILFAACCAAQAAVMVAGPPAPAGTGTNVVQGKVVQDPGGQGIRKVKVILSGAVGGRLAEVQAFTDENGHFKVEGLEPADYSVRLERAGYAVVSNKELRKPIKVVDGQEVKDLLFHMQAAGLILGKILDADGDPLPNVGVTALPSEGATRNLGRAGSAVTNDLGEYRIADLPAGKYKVQANLGQNEAVASTTSEKGAAKERLVYVTTYFPGTIDQHQAAVVEVAAGGTASANFGLQMSRAYRVSGTIAGLGDKSMGQLMLMGTSGMRVEQALTPGGKFEFPNVLPGTYHLQVMMISGFLNGQSPSLKMERVRTPIEVNGADVIGLELQVEASGGDVSGKFHLDGTDKINWSELTVMLMPMVRGQDESEEEEFGYQRSMPAQVKEDGSFEIKDAPSGTVQLAVGAASDKFRDYYTKSVSLGGRDVVDTGFTVSADTLLDVVVSAKGAGIDGTVVDADGKAVPRATVVTAPASGKLARPDAYQFAQSDDTGHFSVKGMNPGEFVVLALEELTGNFRAPEFAKKYEGKGEKVQLEEGSKKTVVVKVIPSE